MAVFAFELFFLHTLSHESFIKKNLEGEQYKDLLFPHFGLDPVAFKGRGKDD